MIKLPIYQNYSFYYDIYLDKVTYTFSFAWNDIVKSFLFTMESKDETIVFDKIALVPGVDFLKTSGIGELGKLYLIDTQNYIDNEPLQIDDFISRFQLIYVNKDDI
jgi:hypothetical protein